ncbi:Probable methionine--tRNA ligase, cytoplasmic; AltName: Full=Methionyl-tRNA synthetase; Short=MetRS [Serendipita indica DSM 11827]|nr:Probable methionine--tRNA ligase, cytoplasmic; AltName: Full=Methionyl-tRNA synthetase; Short=MetRS [Serendipita indica DSM 11827]
MAEQKLRDAPGLLRKQRVNGEVPLPKDGEPNVLITSALPYCNNMPHLGNIIGSTLSADVFSRYNRAKNRNTLYICGTDEYGTATERQAMKEGKTPKELCDHYWKVHKSTYDWFELDFDYFGRTSTPLHTEVTQEVFVNLRKNQLLERKETLQLYCEDDQKFLADRFAEGTCPYCSYPDARGDQCDGCSRTLDAIELINPRCVDNTSHKVVTKASTHMYLRLDAIQPKTEAWIKQSWKKGKWAPNAVINTQGEIIDSRLKLGLKPSAITRDLKWGVPVPAGGGVDEQGTESKVIYCWFDAPLGYPSITANLTAEWKQWWFNPDKVKLFQFMGKDNIYFQQVFIYFTVFFPSMLIGDGRPWTMLHHVSGTEFLNYEGGKFSKSRNLGVFGTQAQETGVPSSVWRYYLLANRPETGDSMFSWSDFIAANNGVLLNNFGNFVNRIIKFTVAKFQSTIPPGDAPGPLRLPEDSEDYTFVADVNKLIHTYNTLMDAVRIREAVQVVMQLSARGNLYLQSAGLSNRLLTEQPERCAQVVSRALNLVWILSAMIGPFMPSTERSICQQLNAPLRSIPDGIAEGEAGTEGAGFSIDLLGGHVLGTPDYLFTMIDDKEGKKTEEWRTKFGSSAPPAANAQSSGGATGSKGKGKAGGKKANVASETGAEASTSGDGLVAAVKEKVKKVKEPKKKPKVDNGEPSTAPKQSESDVAAKRAEAEVKKDTMESTTSEPLPSAGTGAQALADSIELDATTK